MSRRIVIAFMAVVMMFAASCQRRPFGDKTTGVNLLLRVNTKIVNNNDVQVPDVMRVDLYDPVTGALKYTDYLGATGGYIYPSPGSYDVIVYNVGTESTQIRNESNFKKVEAYTSDVSMFLRAQLAKFLEKRAQARAERERARAEAQGRTKGEDPQTSAPVERIVYEPDYLFVGHARGAEIPVLLDDEEQREVVLEVDAHSVVETWKVSAVNIKGMEYVQSVVAIISGQVGSRFIGTEECSDHVVSIYFEMQKNTAESTVHGTFNTFGKHPMEQAEISFDLRVTDISGEEHHYHFDVDDQFENNSDFHIVVDEPIEVEKPSGGGGFTPSVEDWEEVRTEINL